MMRQNKAISFVVLTFVIVSLFPNTLSAQQLLNLDFEKKSIEHPLRPWGWDINNSNSSKFSMDSIVKHSGKYSLKIEGDSIDYSSFDMSFDIEPYELLNKKITINGYIKTHNFTGKAFISLSDFIQSKFDFPQDRTPLVIKSKEIETNTDWTKISLTYLVKDDLTSLNLKINFQGIGSVWFDDFSLEVEDKTYHEVQIAKPFSKEQLNWIENKSYPLKSVDASSLTESNGNILNDLEPFKEMVGKSRLIALGESTHGTSEFFRLKHRVLEYAVKNLNVRVFALEGNMLTIENINKYVLTGNGTAKESMKGIFMVWYNKEVLNMIEWVKNYNANNPDKKVQFVGYDIQEVIPAVDSLQNFLKEKSPTLLLKHSNFLKNIRDNGGYGVASSASDSQKLEWYNTSLDVLKDIKSKEKNWLNSTTNEKEKKEIIWGIQYANLIKQFVENNYRGHLSFYRDKAMSENIAWFLSREKSNHRILIWAHDYHISRGDHKIDDFNIYNGLSMGAHLSKVFGRNYKAFGISTYQGDYRGMVSYSNFNSIKCPLYNSPKGTLDEVLHQLTLQNKSIGIILNLKKARSQEWLVKPLPMRFANHVNIEYGYWTRFSIPFQFDGIFFIDKTSSAKQL